MIRTCFRRRNFRWPVTLLLAFILLLSGREAEGQERFRKSPPLPGPLREIRLPALESYKIGNGLTVVLAPREKSPTVLLQLIIPAGLKDSPRDRPALAEFTARMIRRGSKAYSADALETMIESVGGGFSISVSMDTTVLTFRVLKGNMERAMSLLSSMILEPTFADRELLAVRRGLASDLRTLADDPSYAAGRHLLRLLFEDHPYGIAAYDEDVVRLISQRDVTAFYQRHYRPDGSAFVVSGDFTLEIAVQRVSHYFNTWDPSGVEHPAPPAVQPNNRDRVCLLDYPRIGDALVLVGNVAGLLTGSDYFSFLVLNQILGGTTGSRLFMNLRESKGYAYDAFSEFEFFQESGLFWARARVLPRNAAPAIREILKELKTLSTEPIAPGEIEQAKAYLIGNLPLQFESPEGYARRISWKVASLRADVRWTAESEDLMRVTATKVLEVAQKVFSPRPLIIVVGPKDVLMDPLLQEFDTIELYDSKGVLVQTTAREGGRR